MKPKKTKEDKVHGDDYKHPAFGSIEVARVNGKKVLFQSSIKHQHYIELKINRATLIRNLHSDHIHGDITPIIEVAMSEQQWATMVSSLNMGGGTPCTIQKAPIQNSQMEELPELELESSKDIFIDEMRVHLKGAVKRADDLLNKLEELLSQPSIRKKEVSKLKHDLEMLKQDVRSNTPFIEDQFKRDIEKTVEAGKCEIDGFFLRRLVGLGLGHLIEDAKSEAPLIIENENVKERKKLK